MWNEVMAVACALTAAPPLAAGQQRPQTRQACVESPASTSTSSRRGRRTPAGGGRRRPPRCRAGGTGRSPLAQGGSVRRGVLAHQPARVRLRPGGPGLHRHRQRRTSPRSRSASTRSRSQSTARWSRGPTARLGARPAPWPGVAVQCWSGGTRQRQQVGPSPEPRRGWRREYRARRRGAVNPGTVPVSRRLSPRSTSTSTDRGSPTRRSAVRDHEALAPVATHSAAVAGRREAGCR